MHKEIKSNKGKKALKRSLSVTMACVMLIAFSLLKVQAADKMYIDAYPGPASVGTTYNGGLYNTTVRWQKSSLSVRGYFMTVYNSSGTKVISTTVTSNPNQTTERLFGLRAGNYYIFISALDSNYKLTDSHWGLRIYMDYTGINYFGEILYDNPFA